MIVPATSCRGSSGRAASAGSHPDATAGESLSPHAAAASTATPTATAASTLIALASTCNMLADMSRNLQTVNTYLDGFRKNDHEQILSCLTDDIQWTVFGGFRLTGKDAYDKAIDGAPEFIDPPELEVVRMVEQDDVVMAELTGVAKRAAGGEMRMSMAEVFVMRDGKIAERRAWVIELKENDFR
jgi:ketosteroid isomerase-like protein